MIIGLDQSQRISMICGSFGLHRESVALIVSHSHRRPVRVTVPLCLRSSDSKGKAGISVLVTGE